MTNSRKKLGNPSDQQGELDNTPLILVVDDALVNIQMLSSVLRKERYEVQKLSDPKLAIPFIKEFLPDLILLDIQMPDISGIELCKMIKNDPKTSNIPIIFLTGLDNPQDKIQGLNVGGFDYITKPFYVQEVLLRVRNCLLAHNLKNALEDKNRILQQALDINKENLLYFQEGRHKETEPVSLKNSNGIENGIEAMRNQQRSLDLILDSVNYLETAHQDNATSLEHIHCIKKQTQDLLSLFNECLNEISLSDLKSSN